MTKLSTLRQFSLFAGRCLTTIKDNTDVIWINKYAEEFVRVFPTLVKHTTEYSNYCILENVKPNFQLFSHELAHCAELVWRGQEYRLALPNFGWDENKITQFTLYQALIECRVIAFQAHILQLAAPRFRSKGEPLSPEIMGVFLSHRVKVNKPSSGYIKGVHTPQFFQDQINQQIEEIAPVFAAVWERTLAVIDNIACAD